MTSPPTHLIVVCCHAIWLGGPSAGRHASEWLIADFQRGETPTFIEHARAGVRELSQDAGAALVFSGGPTRRETPLSEAQSYVNLARASNYFGLLDHHHNGTPPSSSPSTSPSTSTRVLIEPRALDSYHNILFSLTLFRYTFSVWPGRLTIVSHGFKRARLIDGHCVAIGVPLDRIAFVGVDPPRGEGGKEEEDAEVKGWPGIAEAERHWSQDPHGVGAVLAAKRSRRNPWRVWQGVFPEEAGGGGGAWGLAVTEAPGGGEMLDDGAVRPW